MRNLQIQISDVDGGGTITKDEIQDWLDASGLSDADDIVNLFMVCACFHMLTSLCVHVSVLRK